jgi:hypothetical protein
MKHFGTLLSLMMLLGGVGLSIGACAEDTPLGTTSSGPGGGNDDDGEDEDGEDEDGPSSGPSGSDVCLLHNCNSDDECGGCAEGRVHCKLDEHRCVACGEQGECPEGQSCSSFGQCVPEGLECPTDPAGAPTIACSDSGDCAACDPAHQVCDPATQKCVACTEFDTAECQSTDICRDGVCTQACSGECTSDNDCSDCQGAKACHQHKCSECSDTYACPAGQYCTDNGTCAPICGSQEAPGVCNYDEDCQGCGSLVGEQAQFVCNVPINGGSGQCIPIAPGCADIGGLVLPPPFNQVTNLCSEDANCADVGVTYNVGKALRDLTGFGEPGDFVEIADANIEYPMPVCATILSVPTGGDEPIECGVCVPCREDSDCQDIDIDQLTGQLFPGLAALDALFGPNEHKIYMYCETIAAGYGACLPCPGLLNDCGTDGGGGGGGGGSGTCDHGSDTVGTALDPACDDCAATVCGFDSFCCETEWDQTCVDEAAEACGGGGCHDPCATGPALPPSCGECEATVCDLDPFCCDDLEGSWDGQCVAEAGEACGITCG